MRCHECGHEQDGGRFCGRCGAVQLDASRPEGAPEDRGRHTNGAAAATKAGAPRGIQVAGVAVILIVAVLVAANSRPDEVSDPGPVTVPTPDRSTVTPTKSEAASPTPAASPLPTEFARPTDTMLLIDTGAGDAAIVDLDTGRWAEVGLEGQRPGDQPFRLWPLGDSVVVGWGEVWAVTPGREMEAQLLGEATYFVPDADPDRVWLIDYEGGSIGQGVPTWTLVEGKDGDVIHQAEGVEGQFAVRGIPSGLVLRAPDEQLSVYDPSTGEISDYELKARYIAAAGPDHVVWCGEGCQTLVSVRKDGAVLIDDGGRGGAFHPRSVWLSDDGAYIAAVTPVIPEVDPTLAIFDAVTGEQLLQTGPLTSASVTGAWTRDDQFFYLMLELPRREDGYVGPGTGLVVGRWTPRGAEQIRVSISPLIGGIRTGSRQFVTYPSCALASLSEGPATTAGCPSQDAAS